MPAKPALSTPAARRAYRGPALFSFGFRPFFLFAALWAVAAPWLWLATYLDGALEPLALTRNWHVHEMLFGYVAAVVAGFLTTAVPNWTGRMPIIGAPLAFLAFVWVCGRLAMLFEAQLGWIAAATDSAFLILFATAIWREIVTGENWRNAPVAGLVTALAAANIAFHAASAAPFLAPVAERVAMAAIFLLISLIGGRITPSFTRNWLAQQRAKRFPAPTSNFDQACQAVALVGAALWIVAPDAWVSGVSMIAAGAAAALRLSRWRGAMAWREPLVWILHAGYFWLALALALIGASILAPNVIPRTAGFHALSVGAMGVMTIAVMTRATLGHTGRALHADAPILAIYLLINLAALVRTLSPFLLDAQPLALRAAGLLWSAAFAGFAIVFGPMLLGPRKRT
jgi:uncharacterized protein involved in response to NO